LIFSERDSMSRKATKGDAQIGKVDVFRGISFDDWLKLFMQVCSDSILLCCALWLILGTSIAFFLLDEVNTTLQMKSFDISWSQTHIKLVSDRTLFDWQSSVSTTPLGSSYCLSSSSFLPVACGLAAGQHITVVEQARKLITVHQFNNEPLRILMACLSSGLRPTDAFITSTLQKHLFREMKLADTAVKSPEVLKWNSLNKRYAPTAQSGKVEDGAEEDADDGVPDQGGDQETGTTATAGSPNLPEIPTKNNPVIVAIYGQICIAAKSYQSAICEFLLSYAYMPLLADAVDSLSVTCI
jgi:general transcription factor 3C polypeptide 3 (transcription factor C subunit 4)